MRTCAVVAVPRGGDEKQLFAYIEPKQGSAPGIAELRAFLRQRLPDYMLPSAVVAVQEMPLTSTGKVDRKALPVPGDVPSDRAVASIAPRTGLESTIAGIWVELFRYKQIGVDDDFFALGGHSLLGFRLIARLREELGVELPVRVLFESPTIAGLAAWIENHRAENGASLKEQSNWRFLVPIQRGGAETPIFLVPGGGGGDEEFLVYARLARYLGEECPLYGLRARGSDGSDPPHKRVEEMAADYLNEVRALQPQGPYFLAGECFGGIVAYEMARQLLAQEQEVALLALLDTPRPTPVGHALFATRRLFRFITDSWRENVGERIKFHWKTLKRIEPSRRPSYFLDKLGKAVVVIADQLHIRKMRDPDGARRRSERVRRVRFEYPRRLQQYKPRPYRGRLTLLVNESVSRKRPDRGWAELVGGQVEIHRIPGDHFSYIREHAGEAAAELKRCLEQARIQPRCCRRNMR